MSKADYLERAKHVGYCWSQLPPSDSTKFSDFVEYARFYLCTKASVLMKDPIWENYSDLDILAEYFAWIYRESEDMKKSFEKDTGITSGDIEEMHDWFDRMIDKNKVELEQKAEELEDINFDAADVMGS